jgi:hypothetical protein
MEDLEELSAAQFKAIANRLHDIEQGRE